MAEVSFALLCPSRTAESHSQIVISTLLFRNLIARGAGSLRPSSGCTCFGLDQFLASASLVSHFSAPLLVVLDACPVVKGWSVRLRMWRDRLVCPPANVARQVETLDA